MSEKGGADDEDSDEVASSGKKGFREEKRDSFQSVRNSSPASSRKSVSLNRSADLEKEGENLSDENDSHGDVEEDPDNEEPSDQQEMQQEQDPDENDQEDDFDDAGEGNEIGDVLNRIFEFHLNSYNLPQSRTMKLKRNYLYLLRVRRIRPLPAAATGVAVVTAAAGTARRAVLLAAAASERAFQTAAS